MTDVIIDIKSTQQGIDDEDVIELSTCGKMAVRDGKYMLSYLENQAIKDEVVKNVINVADNKATMLRSGSVESRLVIEQGKRNKCFYRIPQGELVLGIFGKRVVNELSENGGFVKLDYTIDVENDFLSSNTVEINVRRVEEN